MTAAVHAITKGHPHAATSPGSGWVRLTELTVAAGLYRYTYSFCDLELRADRTTCELWFEDITGQTSQAIPLLATLTTDGIQIPAPHPASHHSQVLAGMGGHLVPISQSVSLLAKLHRSLQLHPHSVTDPSQFGPQYVRQVENLIAAYTVADATSRRVALATCTAGFCGNANELLTAVTTATS